MQCDTSCALAADFRKQQPARWWRVVTGKTRKFLIKILKTEAEAKRCGVLKKELAHFCDLR